MWGYYTTVPLIMENHMEKKMDNDMENCDSVGLYRDYQGTGLQLRN